MTTESLTMALLEGGTAAIARAVSVVENGRLGFESLLAAIHPRLGRARRIGITGPPGAGKSTLTERMVFAWRAAGLKVAVIAVDPTSPYTGGALLGDRIRMERVALDPGVYIRSMATRGTLGGLATATREVADVLDAAGFDRVLVETVGVGQSELDVTGMTDSTVLVLVPESGDGIQALKSGVMEAADLFVINKADRPGADRLARDIELALDLRLGKVARNVPAHHGALRSNPGDSVSSSEPVGWRPPVLTTVANQDTGTAELITALDQHWETTTASGELESRRRKRLTRRMHDVIDRSVRSWVWQESPAAGMVSSHLSAVEHGQRSPYDVAAEVIGILKEGVRA
jgi:LAO/AO transport system kinase